jgi:hypothetical protein
MWEKKLLGANGKVWWPHQFSGHKLQLKLEDAVKTQAETAMHIQVTILHRYQLTS